MNAANRDAPRVVDLFDSKPHPPFGVPAIEVLGRERRADNDGIIGIRPGRASVCHCHCDGEQHAARELEFHALASDKITSALSERCTKV